MNFLQLMIIGYLIVTALLICSCRRYAIPLWKAPVTALLAMLIGYGGSRLMYWVENGSLQGMSFYGAIFLIPLLMPMAARLFRMKTMAVMDACGPGIAFVAMLEKLNCLQQECCEGRAMVWKLLGHTFYRFPSQIVESIAGLVIAIVLTQLLLRGKRRGGLYPLFMLIYGVARFILHWFRDTVPFVWFLPAGNFWSLISIAAGWVLLWRQCFCSAGEKQC